VEEKTTWGFPKGLSVKGDSGDQLEIVASPHLQEKEWEILSSQIKGCLPGGLFGGFLVKEKGFAKRLRSCVKRGSTTFL